jgi:amino acid transporter
MVFATNVGQLVPFLEGPTGAAVFLVLMFAVLAAVNIAGVRQGTALNTVATAAKLLPLLLLVLVGPFLVDPAHLSVVQAPPASAIARTSILLIFAFSGVESALMPSGEVKDVARTTSPRPRLRWLTPPGECLAPGDERSFSSAPRCRCSATSAA